MDCVRTNVALSDLDDVWMTHSAHVLTSLEHVTDLQTIFRLGDSFAEARIARRLVHEKTCGYVRVALRVLLQDVVVLLHEFQIAPLLEVSVGDLEERF